MNDSNITAKKAFARYAEHLDTCAVCVPPHYRHFCPTGQSLARAWAKTELSTRQRFYLGGGDTPYPGLPGMEG